MRGHFRLNEPPGRKRIYQEKKSDTEKKAFIFRDVTELCEDFDDFAQNAEFGQAFELDEKYICKARNVNGYAELFYEDENEEIIGF